MMEPRESKGAFGWWDSDAKMTDEERELAEHWLAYALKLASNYCLRVGIVRGWRWGIDDAHHAAVKAVCTTAHFICRHRNSFQWDWQIKHELKHAVIRQLKHKDRASKLDAIAFSTLEAEEDGYYDEWHPIDDDPKRKLGEKLNLDVLDGKLILEEAETYLTMTEMELLRLHLLGHSIREISHRTLVSMWHVDEMNKRTLNKIRDRLKQNRQE